MSHKSRDMKRIAIGICLSLIVNLSFSQTIINAERLIDGKDSTIYSFALTYSGSRGNSSTNQFGATPTIILVREKNDFMVFGGYSLLSQSNNNILNAGFVHLRHIFKINKRIGTFEFYQLQFNEVLLLNRREVFGAGLNLKLIIGDSLKLDVSAGLMREVEILNKTTLQDDELSETRYLRLSAVNSFKWQIGSIIKINNVVYYQPYIKDFRDFRLLDDFTLGITISKRIELVTSLTFRYDSQPPGLLGKTDSTVSTGINIKF